MGKALNSKTLWKSIVSTSLALFMILGLTPRMSLTARADGEHQINNTISDIVNLSITKDGRDELKKWLLDMAFILKLVP